MTADILGSLKIAVLCGGPGAEREVSLASGATVFSALRQAGLDAVKIEVPEKGHEKVVEDLDCHVAVLMLHGEFGEDGHAQEILEKKGIAFTGSDAKACAVTMDKNASKTLFRDKGIPTLPWVAASAGDDVKRMLRDAGLAAPLVVKPNSRGSSVGVSIVHDLGGLDEAVNLALSMDDKVLIEQFAEGRELTVGWLNGQLLPAIELAPDGTFYDYRAKYLSDRTKYLCPAELGEAETLVYEVAQKVIDHSLVRDLSRVDIILKEKQPYVLEINTLPGFTAHSLVPLAARTAGIAMPDLCRRLVEMAALRGNLL